MDRMRKRGFTLIELMVVLAIMAIIIGIAVPSIVNYRKLAEFRKNESNAKTVYLAAESRLAYYRNSGQWESFQKEVLAEGQAAVLPEGKSDRIYGITLGGDGDDAVRELLDGYTYDKDMLNAGIAIEVDIESGQVYSAFYGTRCKGLDYSADDHDGVLTMQKRTYDERKDRLLGYYSVEDTVNVVELKPKRLKITSINLVNGETLALNWSSNVGTSLDVNYEIQFYKKARGGGDDSLLFGVSVSPSDMRTHGWTTEQGSAGNLISLPVTKADAQTTNTENWSFPVTIQDGKYVLTLDAMMSAEVTEAMAKQPENSNVLKTSSVSITRLAQISEALKEPQNIYATVKASANYSHAADTATDYRASEEVSSNVANTMFANDSEAGNEKIAAFRHLSNIRYYKKELANFTLTSKNMDWTAVGTGLYDFALEQQAGRSIQLLVWKENQKENAQDFPTVPLLQAGYSLTGNGQNTRISNVWLGEDSVIKDSDADCLGCDKAAYLGLFGEVEGTVQNLYFQDPYLELTAENAGIKAAGTASAEAGEQTTLQPVTDHNTLTGVGILAGRSQGSLTNIEIQVTKASTATVRVALTGDEATANQEKAVGGIVGILAGKTAGSTTWEPLQTGTFDGLKMNGTVEVSVPGITLTTDTDRINTAMSGIGGIIGYAFMRGSAHAQVAISNCENHAAVSGNQYTGGIVGNLRTSWNTLTQGNAQNMASLKDSTSDGLVLCAADSSPETTEGYYFGGIAGYANRTVIYNATSASGRAAGFTYDNSKQNLLKGTYVGGIVGYGRDAMLSNCNTQKGGYILGAQEVGGIIGALEGDSTLHATSEVKVTTNASYVIGQKYVGGIVGHNETGTIENCINNGVAAGYDQYVGGITGYNGTKAVIKDCASYLSDYDSSIFRMIVDDWKATADYAGGIAGYNNGAIRFDQASEAVANKSVSSIIVGRNYVGGIAGFNDVSGTLDVHYTIVGGRIYAYEDCAGGAFGFNASEDVLEQNLTIQPQSVQGRYYVGGVIGANVVKLSQNRTMDGIRTDNRLGSVTAQAFCGGLIGYHRTYNNDVSGSEELAALLPGLDKGNAPGKVSHMADKYTLTIEAGDDPINNLPVRAYLYAGGVVGFSEKGSSLLIQKCVNEGNIAFPSKGTFADSSASDGVTLGNFAKSRIGGSLSDNAKDITLHLTGGIIGVNLSGQTIRHCSNKGSVSGFSGAGGIVGLNAGTVKNCELTDNFGNAALSYLGGIVGINLHGEVQNCTTRQNKTVSGKNGVGGIVGWNLDDGIIQNCTSLANINAAGNAAGGTAGRNTGTITLTAEQENTGKKTISGKNSVGGIVGINEAGGKLELAGNSTSGEQIVVGSGVSVSGQEKVGGIVGENYGALGKSGADRLVSAAASVHASSGYAGGIAGWTSGNIYNAENRSGSVAADKGNAGGITAWNQKGNTISGSLNTGNVTASAGYAGGIAAENQGIITGCEVKNAIIQSRGVQEAGAISAVNKAGGTISESVSSDGIILNSTGLIFGGITGRNQGTVENTNISKMPGAAGQHQRTDRWRSGGSQ